MPTANDIWDSTFEKDIQVKAPDERIIRFFEKNKTNGRILDLGCGPGRHVIYLANLGYQITGLDSSSVALSSARKLLDGNTNATLIEHDMNKKFPFADNYFSVVICTRVIHHGIVSQIRKWANEIARITATGGTLLLIVLSANDLRAKSGKEIEPNTRIGIIDTFDPEVAHHFFTPAEIQELFANFEIKQIEEYFAPVGEGYGNMKYYFVEMKKR